MNRLLSFTPEPFETDLELAGALRAYDATRSGSDRESDFENARWRGPSAFARSRRRAGARPAPYPATSTAAAPFDSQAFRQRIVRIANQELARWGNGAIKETNPRTRRVLQDYWKTGAGANFSEDQLGDPAFQKAHPWSAAFISWVMRTAGAGNAFKYSPAHAAYTRAAIDNRLANNSNPFKAYRITELAPQVGDLVCKSRAGSGAAYENIKPGMKTHCDIVTEVRPDNLTVVGGNVNNSVARKTLRSDANGRIAEPDYFAVIRIGAAQPSVPIAPSPTPVTPSAGSAPKLIKQESIPTGTTLYVEIDLKVVDKFGIAAPPVTGDLHSGRLRARRGRGPDPLPAWSQGRKNPPTGDRPVLEQPALPVRRIARGRQRQRTQRHSRGADAGFALGSRASAQTRRLGRLSRASAGGLARLWAASSGEVRAGSRQSHPRLP